MKKLLFMVIGFMFAAQAAFASPMGDRMNLETLNKSDAQVLFQDNAMSQDVVVLNNGQMKALKGKSWWTRLRNKITTPSNLMTIVSVAAYFYPPTAVASVGFGSWWNTYTAGYMWAF
jgi:hypothetical protein